MSMSGRGVLRALALVCAGGLCLSAAGAAGEELTDRGAKGRKYPIQVVSTPAGAMIYVNSKEYKPEGHTPKRVRLPKGRFRLIVELKGYQPAERIITVEGRATEVFRLEAEVRPATIVVETSNRAFHGATITVDGADKGNVPATVKLDPGRHLVEITLEGYQKWSRWYTLGEGEKQQIEFVLDRIPPPPPRPRPLPARVEITPPPIIVERPLPPPERPYMAGRVILKGGVDLGGSVNATLNSVSSSKSGELTPGFGLEGNHLLGPYFMLGYYVGLVLPKDSDVGARDYVLDIAPVVKLRLPIRSVGRDILELFVGGRGGFTLHALSGDAKSAWSSAGMDFSTGPGWNVAGVGGGQLNFSRHVGVMLEGGYRYSRVYFRSDPNKLDLSFGQVTLSAGVVVLY